MKISLSKQSLQTALQNLGKATPTRSTIPILNTVLFTANDSLSLRTTDLEISIIALVESKISEKRLCRHPLQNVERYGECHAGHGTGYRG